MARWINITKAPFDFRWPSGAITAFTRKGSFFVKDEAADFAIAQGYADEGKADSKARSSKGGAKRSPARKDKESPTVTATDKRPAEAVDNEAVADADRTADRRPVDNDAGER